jgi:hypothetical protein
MSKSKKSIFRSAGEAVGVLAAEVVVGTGKIVDAAGEKLDKAKTALSNLTHKKKAVKKAPRKASKKAPRKALKKAAKKSSRKTAPKKPAAKKAVRKAARKTATKK